MWVIGLILVAFMVFIIAFVAREASKKILCNKCGHVFERDDSKTVDFKYNGEFKKVQECPKCKEYVDI